MEWILLIHLEHRHLMILGLDWMGLRSSEFVKGSQSAVFGSEAVGGVIN